MLQQFAAWLAQTSISRFIQDVLWIIPLVQTFHILAIAAVLSSVAMIDLRIFGLSGRDATMAETAARYVPWIWGGLLVLALTGAALITGEPVRSLTNPAFQIKMSLLVVAIAVTFLFQQSVRVKAGAWDAARQPPGGVKAAALATLFLWFAIAVFGRWIAYVIVDYAA
jgi:uncharacterized membrane protein SirB2